MPKHLRLRGLFAALVALLFSLAGCGARSGLREPEPVADVVEAGPDVPTACVPVEDHCGASEVCGNGLDDNCDGRVDEDCGCEPGSVQSCFAGPPGRRHVGACSDGSQTCEMSRHWGACVGGIVPGSDACNGADNLCNGCSRRDDCPILCPSPGDSRIPEAVPFHEYPLRGGDFYHGAAARWTWEVHGGPCDSVSPQASFGIRGTHEENAVLLPRVSGEHTVRLTVITPSGAELSCQWAVQVAGPGMRIEMCYPESEINDLDLFLHRPNTRSNWYEPHEPDAFVPTADACGWDNCEAHLRGTGTDFPPTPVARADWGYANSPLSECEHGPYGGEWQRLGHCANPRLDLDNNLAEGRGVPENINVDVPRDGDNFRIMVQNFSGRRGHPLVNIYCAGRRTATFGAPPDAIEHFDGVGGGDRIGAIWRVADVTTHVDASGRTTGCDVALIHPPGRSSGYYVTLDDFSY